MRTPASSAGAAAASSSTASSIDLGRVGDVVEVDPQPVLDQLAAGRIPVVSSIAPDLDHPGQLAQRERGCRGRRPRGRPGRRASSSSSPTSPGLYADWPNRDSLVSHLTSTELRAMLPTLESGMIPKMQACLDAVEGGVETAAIIDGRVPHSVLVEIFTSKGIGTEVVAGDG